jgi:hypothetical protein
MRYPGRMPPALHYPEITPPAGWTPRREGSQIRLSPPAGTAGGDAAILVGPVLGRHERLPPPERLIELALALEEETRFTVTARGAARPVETEGGMGGTCLEVTGYVRPSAPPERRLYVVFSDDRCYYGISYLAPAEAFAASEEAFWQAARSLRPFDGEVLPAPEPPPGAGSPMSGYED